MRDDGPVVIALDGSPQSPQTLDWGLAEAGLRGAPVVLARACPRLHDLVHPAAGSGFTATEPDLDVRQYLELSLERARHSSPELRVEARLLHAPEAVVIRDLSETAQLLVVGHRGTGPRRRKLGPVSAYLAAHAACPVAVVRSPQPTDRAGPVVVGVDGAARASVAAARVAAREAALRGVALVVVHARQTTVPDVVDERLLRQATDADRAYRSAQRIAGRLRRAHPGLEVRLHLPDDDPAHGLLKAARDAQLLVVGSRGVGASPGMLLGPVTVAALREPTVTVLVVHRTEATPAPEPVHAARDTAVTR
jgi:nucleotide-binding universal stress UspA family protein